MKNGRIKEEMMKEIEKEVKICKKCDLYKGEKMLYLDMEI
jgi:hypothetical protein